MKSINRILLLIVVFLTINAAVSAQETMYLYKDGAVVGEHVLAEVDSVIFYKAEVPNENIVTDIDGNTYNTVVIGTQTWMAENLKTITYNDGTEISNVINGDSWWQLTSGAYCWYNNDESTYKEAYGALYNWYAVETDKLCPIGWHVPSDDEWKVLEAYIGMSQVEIDKDGINNRGTGFGSKLKEGGEFGLEIKLGSYGRCGTGWCDYEQEDATYWLADDTNWQGYIYGFLRKFTPEDIIYRSSYEKANGYSVRCIQD